MRGSPSVFIGAAALLLVALLCSCGYVGDPRPPALNIPVGVSDLKAHQHGDTVVVEFTIPVLTTEGLALKLGQVELLAGPPVPEPFDFDKWSAQARHLDTASLQTGPARVTAPAAAWAGKEILFRVRIFSAQGRDSGWSDFTNLNVLPPLKAPVSVRAEVVPQGIRLTWQISTGTPGASFRIFRRSGTQEQFAAIGTANGNEYIDTTSEYDRPYTYTVQAFEESGNSKSESEMSDPVEITAVDKFPPAVPSGLEVLAGPGSVELAWDRNQEIDVRGYRIHRAVEDGPVQAADDIVPAPSYSDHNVESGKRYRYAVSAIDQLGNESAPSAPVEIKVP